MIQDLTKEELRWRYTILMYSLSDAIESEISQELFKEYGPLDHLACAALVYLIESRAITIRLHKKGQKGNALFTTTRLQMEKTAWTEPSELEAYDRPSTRDIPVPNLFEKDDNQGYTHVSLDFNIPDTKVGRICDELIGYLRQACKKDVAIINFAVFVCIYFKEVHDYSYAIRSTLTWSFLYDLWTSSPQTPYEVIDVMEHLLGDCGKVYDPFMRTGTNLLFAEEEYYAQAPDKEHLYASMLWRASMGADVEYMEISDCTQSWKPQDCDTIIATPELGQNVTDENGNQQPIASWLLSKLSDTMDFPNRRALVILPANVLNASGKMDRVRHDIVESNLLETVVLLPAGLFPKTGIATAIIMLRNGRGADDGVTFADFSYFVKDEMDREEEDKSELDSEWAIDQYDKGNPRFVKQVSVDEIRLMDYDWFAPRYVKDEVDIPHGFTKTKLSTFFEDFVSYPMLMGANAYVLQEQDMVSEPFGYEMACDRLSDIGEYNEEDFFSIRDSFFAISLKNGLKTYFSPEVPAFSCELHAVPCDFYNYRVNPDVIDVDYLRLLLFDAYSKIDSKDKTQKDIFQSLMNTEYIIPTSVEEQKRLYEEAKFNHAIEKARKEGLDEAVERMKQEYMMEVRMRKHDMKPFLSQLDSQAKLIMFYLDKIEGNDQVVSAIRSKLTGVSNAVSELRLHLNRLTEEDIYGTPEKLNPLDILKEFVGTFDNYSVELDVDTLALEDAGITIPYISFSPVDFSTLVGTIKENAVAHAFVDERLKYHFRISFSYDKAKERYIIDFMNDGKPMPQGMDKFRYGLKGEKGARSQGTGLGGYRVKSIARHYGGDYDVFCNRTQGLVTTIRVELPPYKE